MTASNNVNVHHVYESLHKDGSTRVCTSVCVGVVEGEKPINTEMQDE